MTLEPGDQRHGTRNGYKHHGCRCLVCTAANTAYERSNHSGGYRRVPCPSCGGPMLPDSKTCRGCSAATIAARPDGPKGALRGSERDQFGATITCVRLDASDAPRTLAAGGTAVNAIRECVEQIDAWEGDWRIVTISTPVTIMRDLDGSRAYVGNEDGEGASSQPVALPEPAYLRKLGRTDLLVPQTVRRPTL